MHNYLADAEYTWMSDPTKQIIWLEAFFEEGLEQGIAIRQEFPNALVLSFTVAETPSGEYMFNMVLSNAV